MEEWRPAPGFDGYEVSDRGRVRSWRRVSAKNPAPKVLSQLIRKHDGYIQVSVQYPDGKNRPILVHRLVCMAWHGEAPEGKPHVCHWDGDPSNNAPANLRWGSHKDNAQDQLRHGRHLHARKTHCKRGHEFTPENTIRCPRGRTCRTCVNEASNRRYRKLHPDGRGRDYNARKMHCKRGHEFTPENTYRAPKGGRACRTCQTVRDRQFKQRKRECRGGQ